MRIALPSIIVLLAAADGCLAQAPTGIAFGPQGGVAQTTLDGAFGRTSAFKTGYVAGVFLRLRPSPNLAFQPEVNLVRQGAKNEQFNGNGVALYNTTHLVYLNVPLLVKVYLGKVLNLQVGPQLGLLLSARQNGETNYVSGGSYVPGTTGSGGYIISGGFVRNSNGSIVSSPSYSQATINVKNDYKNDLAICAGLGADLKNGLSIAARFNYGFTNINNNEAEQNLRDAINIGGLHNRVAQLTLGYAFSGQ